MNDLEPDEKPVTKRAGRAPVRLGRVGTGLLVGGVVVAVGLGGIYLNRRAVADQVLVGWLEKRGIEADVEVERFDWNGFTGRLTVGDPNDPDVRIERVDVDYAIGMPWSQYGAGVLPSRIVLSRPLIKASWIDNKVSFGSLDPLIEEFTSKPPGPKKPGPLIVVDKGEARITTDYGVVSLLANAEVNDGRLRFIKASLPAAALRHASISADDLTATLEAREVSGRLDIKGTASAKALSYTEMKGEQLALSFTGVVPYSQNGEKQAKGAVLLNADLAASALSTQALSASDFKAKLDWNGTIEGWIDAFALTAKADGRIDAGRMRFADNRVEQAVWTAPVLDVKLQRGARAGSDSFSWRVEGAHSLSAARGDVAGFSGRNVRLTSSSLIAGGRDDTFEARGPLRLQMAQAEGYDLSLRQLDGQLKLDVLRDTLTHVSLAGSLNSASSQYNGLGRATSQDAPELAQIKTALADFRLEMPSVRLIADHRGTEFVLGQPARIISRSGAEIRLEGVKRPLFETGRGLTGGAGRLKSSGGGIPQLDLDISSWQSVGGALQADLQGQAKLDFTPVKGVDVATRGRLSVRNGRTTYTASECAAITAAEFRLGENEIRDVAGRLCSGNRPLFEMANGNWRLGGQLQDTRLSATFLQMGLGQAYGPLNVSGDRSGLKLDLGVDRSRVFDMSETARFEPVQGRGNINLASNVWRGGFDLGLPNQPVGTLCLRHDGTSGQGGLAIATVGAECRVPNGFGETIDAPQGGLVFAEFGLQPKALSGLVPAAISEPVSGRAAFVGQMFWADEKLESSGRLVAQDLAFTTPLGKVSGGMGDIRLDSLVPIVVPAGQTVTFNRIDGPLPMGGLKLAFGFEGSSLYLQNASVDLAEGEAFVFDTAAYSSADGLTPPAEIAGKGLEIPVGGKEAWQFGVAIHGLQLNALMQAVGVGEKATLDAEVTGVLPVTFRPEWGFAISDGVLVADRRGSLSIAPEVLGNVDAGVGQIATSEGEQAPVPRNMMQDLAYQALEHLTFTGLRADVNSICLPQNEAGRGIVDPSLGVLCHQLSSGQSGWIPSRLAVDFAINGYYDPPVRKEMRVPLLDVLRGNFMQKKMILPSDTPVTLGLKTSINAYDLASQIMDYIRSQNNPAPNAPDNP